jgi:hypothetical protein
VATFGALCRDWLAHHSAGSARRVIAVARKKRRRSEWEWAMSGVRTGADVD